MFDKLPNNCITNRHFIPANREWSNSVYYFNKNNLKQVYSKDYIADSIIKSYFKLTPKPVKTTRSKRMRDSIRRSTTKQLFVSRSYIKQTGYKSLITVYLYDREQKTLNRRLFLLNHMLGQALNKFSIDLPWTNKVYGDKNKIKNLFLPDKSLKKIKPVTPSKRVKNIAKKITKYNINYKNYNNKIISLILYKANVMKTVFYYYFFKWTLLLLGLNVDMLYKGDYIRHNNYNIQINNRLFIIYKTCKKRNISYINRFNKIIDINHDYVKLFRLYNKLKLKNMYLINAIMHKYIYLCMCNIYNTKNSTFIKFKLHALFIFYYNIFYGVFKDKFVTKQYYALFNMYKSHISNIKFKQLLIGLKLLLNNVYNKDIQLNLVKLKYLYLNSDMFIESITVKLRKSTSKLLRVLKKSLGQIKIPKKMFIDKVNALKKIDTSKPLDFINKFKGLKIGEHTTNIKDSINKVLSDIYTNKYFVSKSSPLNTNIFENIKYKWVTGVRLEAKGRLTKRYTASRSVHRFRYKGNLRNLDAMDISAANSTSERNILQTPSLHMVRNNIKPNIQYSLASSKKRIGAFGIKGWINNN